MNSQIILELADKWDRDVKEHRGSPQDGSKDAELSNAKRDAQMTMKEKLASELRELVAILG